MKNNKFRKKSENSFCIINNQYLKNSLSYLVISMLILILIPAKKSFSQQSIAPLNLKNKHSQNELGFSIKHLKFNQQQSDFNVNFFKDSLQTEYGSNTKIEFDSTY